MQLLKSLFCWQGFDNRNRFIIISSGALLCFIIITRLAASSLIFALCLSLLCLTIYSATLKRRINDSELTQNWLLLPISSFLFIILLIIFIGNTNLYWLLLIPAACSCYSLTFTSKGNKTYILGYNGPVKLSKTAAGAKRSHSVRIEPTLVNSNHNNSSIHEAHEKTNQLPQDAYCAGNSQPIERDDIGELIREKAFENKKIIIIFALGITLAIIANVIHSTFTVTAPVNMPTEIAEVPVESIEAELLHPLEMNDNFTLFLTINNGLTIEWQAQTTTEHSIWSQKSAKGDLSCREIIFDNKVKTRTLDVTVKNTSYYQANFSPLDTKKLVQSIALKSNFKLCDYKFSLKGSQALLTRSNVYGEFLE